MAKTLMVLAVLFLAVVFGAVLADVDEMNGVVVLSCSDEPLFPTKEGAVLVVALTADERHNVTCLYNIQSAGNVVELEGAGAEDGIVLGSIQYAVRVGGTFLGSKNGKRAEVIVVLGHKGCKVVKSVMDGLKMGGAMSSFAQVIEAAKTEARKKNPNAMVDDVVAENVRRTVARLSRDPYVLRPAIDSGKLKIIGAVFDFDTLTAEVVE